MSPVLFRKNPGRILLVAAIVLASGGLLFSGAIKVRIKAGGATLHLKPDSSSPVVGQAQPGMIFEAEETVGEWYQVSLPPDANGFVIAGYVHKDYIEIVSEEKKITGREQRERDKPLRPIQPPPKPAPEKPPKPSGPAKFRLRGGFGLGVGFDRVATGVYQKWSWESEWNEVNIMPGGGAAAELMLGFQIIPALAIEIGVGAQSTGTGTKTEEVTFKRYPISLSLIHDFPSGRSTHFYIGAGADYYLGPRFYLDVSGLECKITYKPAYGFHGLMGLSSKIWNSAFFWYAELRFAGIMTYNWETATVGEYEAIPTEAYQKLTGKGIYLNFGLGYAF